MQPGANLDQQPPCCDQVRDNIVSEDKVVIYIDKFCEYGIPVLDGGASYTVIRFCPWYGSALPTSLRDKWFDAIGKIGMESDDQNLPKEHASDRWWRSA